MGRQTDILGEAGALEGGAGVRRLEELAVLVIEGEDAHEWLSGQVTNAVRETRPGDAVYVLFTTVKGRILSDGLVLHVHRGEGRDELRVLVPRAARGLLRERFDNYIVMEDVEVREADLAVVSVQGPGAAAVVGRLAGDRAPWPSDRLGTGGVDLVVPTGEADALLAALVAAGATPTGEAAWELVRLRRGVPRFGADFGEHTYPQEAGLRDRAVSFTKGCYVGQEVVCMLDTRGKLSRRLVRLEADGDPGELLGQPLLADGAEVGQVSSAVLDPARGKVLGLGLVKARSAEPGTELAAGDRRVYVRGAVV